MMLQAILRRAGVGIGTLFIVSVLIFVGTSVLPGDVAQIILGQMATPETLAVLRAKLGLDQPPYVRYFLWLGNLLTGDLGTSKAGAGARISAALAGGDEENLRRLAHGLKGVAGNIGARDLNQAAANMELAVKQGRRDDYHPLSAILLRNFDQVQKTLSRLADGSASAASGRAGSRPPGGQGLRRRLRIPSKRRRGLCGRWPRFGHARRRSEPRSRGDGAR